MNNKKARGLNGAVFLVFVVFLFAALWFTNQFDQREKEITWKNFQQLVQNDKIESVEVNQNKSVPTGRVEITLKGDDDSDKIRYLYVSDVNEIQDYLKEQNVEYLIRLYSLNFAMSILFSEYCMLVFSKYINSRN